jgi:hypothetical protein
VNVEWAAVRLGILGPELDFLKSAVVLLWGYEIVAEGHRVDFSRRRNELRSC